MSELFDDLKELKAMLKYGEITVSEYERLKADLLAETPPPREPVNPRSGKPAGWYDDPSAEASHQGYWDGETWTGQTRPFDTAKTPPALYKPPKGRIKNSTIVVLIGAVVLGIILIVNQGSEPSIEETFREVEEASNSGNADGSDSPAPERIELKGKGDGATSSFRLNGGSYRVATSVSGECYYSFTLSNPSTGSRVERITTISEPDSTSVMLHGIVAGRYFVEVITGPAPACPWTQVLTSS